MTLTERGGVSLKWWTSLLRVSQKRCSWEFQFTPATVHVVSCRRNMEIVILWSVVIQMSLLTARWRCVTVVYRVLYCNAISVCEFKIRSSSEVVAFVHVLYRISVNLQEVWYWFVPLLHLNLWCCSTLSNFHFSSNLQVRTRLIHIWRRWWTKLLGQLTSQCSSPCLERNWTALTQKTSYATPSPASTRKEPVSTFSRQ